MGCASSTQKFGDTAKHHQPNTSAKQKFFIVIAHPEPQSMCQSIGNTAIEALLAAGHEVKVSRLYEEHFDALSTRKNFKEVKDSAHFKPPVEEAHATETKTFADDVEAELQKLEWCDVLIFQFPLYWFALPAVLKGWVDRIFASTRVYSHAQCFDTGVFKGKRAMLSFTTGGPAFMYTPDGVNGDINSILRPIHRGIFQFVGFSVLSPNILYGAAHVSNDDRHQFLSEWANRVVTLHEEDVIEVGRYA